MLYLNFFKIFPSEVFGARFSDLIYFLIMWEYTVTSVVFFLFSTCICVESLPSSLKDSLNPGINSGAKYSTPNTKIPEIRQKNSCYADVDGKVLNLKPLERVDGTPRFSADYKGKTYSFNPCSPFNLPKVPHVIPNSFGDECLLVAFCLNRTEVDRHYYYTGGVHTNVSFYGEYHSNFTDINLELVYKGIKSMRDKKTHIKLVCDRSRTKEDDALFFIDYDKREKLAVELHHLCCCLDGCAPPEEKKLDKHMLMVIIGVNLGLVLLAALTGALCFVKRTQLQIYFKLPGLHAISSRAFTHFGSMDSGLKKSSAYRDYEPAQQLSKKDTPLLVLDDCFIAEDDLECSQRLGGGLFADTYIGQWRDRTVAIKRLTVNTHEDLPSQSSLNAMRDVVQQLSRHRHKNIVGVIGFSFDSRHPYVVSDFIDGECLKDFSRSRGVHLDWPQRVNICLQIADGMAFLHSTSPPMLHRDLRCANVFITIRDTIKVADFGLVQLVQPIRNKCYRSDCCLKTFKFEGLAFRSTCFADGRKEMSGCPATIKWTAPEILAKPSSKEGDKVLTTACDVYSFGMVMWELIMCEDPFDDITSDEEVMEMVINGMRPEIPSSGEMFALYGDLIKTCWEDEPRKRPTFKQIAAKLKDMFRHARTFQKVINSHKKRQGSPA